MRTATLIAAEIGVFLALLCQPAFTRGKSDCLILRQVLSSYDALRQSNSFYLTLRFESPRCLLAPKLSVTVQRTAGLDMKWTGHGYAKFETVENPPTGRPEGVACVQLRELQHRIQARQGGQISPMSVPDRDCHEPESLIPKTSAITPVQGVRELHIVLKASASREITPGEYGVNALLNYAVLDRHGASLPRELAFTIPVKVVPASAPVRRVQQQRWSPANLLLAPFTLVFGILDILTGNAKGS
jgi:hypothetical protein